MQVQRQHLLGHMLQDVQVSKAAFVNKTQQCFAVRGQVRHSRRRVLSLRWTIRDSDKCLCAAVTSICCVHGGDGRHARTHQQSWAAQVDGFLDLARSIFCRLTEQIHDTAESLRTELQLPALKVLCQLGMRVHVLQCCNLTATLHACRQLLP